MITPVKQTMENRIGKGKPGPGRPKGVPNRITSLLKDAIIEAAINAGGEDGLTGYLEAQAKENPGPFLSLLGKVLPMQVAGGNDGGPAKITFEWLPTGSLPTEDGSGPSEDAC